MSDDGSASMSDARTDGRAAWNADGNADWIVPDWAVPANVRAIITTRSGGASRPPYDSFNLGTRCGDDPIAVARNRGVLRTCLPAEPVWLRQVHGAGVINAQEPGIEPEADAAFARSPNIVCAVLAADCMPVLLADRHGVAVGIAHAGWRGLSAGVLEATVRAMGVAPRELMAWLGPAIGARQFEVGTDVLGAFTREDAGACAAFEPYPGREGKFLCDLYALARRRLAAIGVTEVSGGGYCTVSDARFYSFRRDKTTGRMGAFIWLDA